MNQSKVRQLKFLISAVFLAVASTTTVTSRPSLAESDQPDWGYGGVSNPTQWNELSAEFEACEVVSKDSL